MLNMGYIDKIKANSHGLRELLKLPENISRMKNSLNIPIAIVDVSNCSSNGAKEIFSKTFYSSRVFSHYEQLEAIVRWQNPNLKTVPFKVELGPYGDITADNTLKELQKVYKEIEKQNKIKGVNLSLVSFNLVKDLLKAFNLDFLSYDTNTIRTNLPLRKLLRENILNIDENNKSLKYLLDDKKIIELIEKLVKEKKVKVYIAAGNYEEPKINLSSLAEGAYVVGDVNKIREYPYAYFNKNARGDFNFYINSHYELETKLVNMLKPNTKKLWGTSYSSINYLTSLFPGARTRKNIELFRRIKKRLRKVEVDIPTDKNIRKKGGFLRRLFSSYATTQSL